MDHASPRLVFDLSAGHGERPEEGKTFQDIVLAAKIPVLLVHSRGFGPFRDSIIIDTFVPFLLKSQAKWRTIGAEKRIGSSKHLDAVRQHIE